MSGKTRKDYEKAALEWETNVKAGTESISQYSEGVIEEITANAIGLMFEKYTKGKYPEDEREVYKSLDYLISLLKDYKRTIKITQGGKIDG